MNLKPHFTLNCRQRNWAYSSAHNIWIWTKCLFTLFIASIAKRIIEKKKTHNKWSLNNENKIDTQIWAQYTHGQHNWLRRNSVKTKIHTFQLVRSHSLAGGTVVVDHMHFVMFQMRLANDGAPQWQTHGPDSFIILYFGCIYFGSQFICCESNKFRLCYRYQRLAFSFVLFCCWRCCWRCCCCCCGFALPSFIIIEKSSIITIAYALATAGCVNERDIGDGSVWICGTSTHWRLALYFLLACLGRSHICTSSSYITIHTHNAFTYADRFLLKNTQPQARTHTHTQTYWMLWARVFVHNYHRTKLF